MSKQNKEERYLLFASSISFYDLSHDEFQPVFDADQYLAEIGLLSQRTKWDVESLSEFLLEHPTIFTTMTYMIRDIKFSDSQLISFMFDVDILNSTSKEKIVSYLIQNLENDSNFKGLYIKLLQQHKFDTTKMNSEIGKVENYDFFIAAFKETVKLFIEKNDFLEKRIANKLFDDVRTRISDYFIRKLGFSNLMEAVNLEKYLRIRKRQRDVRSSHGDFGQKRVEKILLNGNFLCIDSLLNKNNINSLEDFEKNYPLLKSSDKLKEFTFVTQMKSNKTLTDKKKPKKFDFVLMYNLKPRILVETNFYEGGGTKIGINIGEYVRLKKTAKQMGFIFVWITDGPFWTETSGKSELLTLFDEYNENELFTYNLFEENLEKIKSILKS